MTYQSNVNIKDEPFSPSIPNVTLAMTDSRPAVMATPSAGSPAKRRRNENEKMQTSTLETKKKLQDAVLDRRKANGYTDLPNILFEEPKACQLTRADLDRREKRKEQNRKAATKCRAKKKEQHAKVEKETAHYVESNEKMQKVLLSMYQKLCTLAMYLSQHLNCGNCRISVDAQEEHKQFIKHTETLLQSWVSEHYKQQCHPATANIDPDDASQLPDIIHNSYTSNAEALCSPPVHGAALSSTPVHGAPLCSTPVYGATVCSAPVNDLVVAKDLGTNYFNLFESNLPSWDLVNLSADIPPNAISSLVMDESLATAVGVANTSFAEFTGDTQNHFIQLPVEYMNNLPDDIFAQGPAITAGSTSLQNDLTDVRHDQDDISVGLSWATHRNDSVPEYPEIGRSHVSISPNLVQPHLLDVSSGKSLTIPVAIQSGIGSCNQNPNNGQQTRQQYQVNADFNNNKQRQSPEVEIAENYSADVEHPSGNNIWPHYHPGISRSTESTFFTFELDHSSSKFVETPGLEPISPFYTQGGSRRM